MRSFFVYYRGYKYGLNDYEYYTCTMTLNNYEKSNVDTFKSKMDYNFEVLSWSLIEE